MKYPMAHRIQIPQPYVRSEATDIRETFKAEYERLKAAAECVPMKSTRVTPLRRKEK